MKKNLFTTLILASLCSVSFAQTHVYKFAGTFTEFGGAGPALTEVLDAACSPAGVNGSFGSEVIATSGGTSPFAKPVFQFSENGGLSYSNSLGITGTYTVHIMFRKTNFAAGSFGFQKIVDFSNGTNDNGLHSNFNGLGASSPSLDNVYGVSPHPIAGTPLVNNQYYLVSIVRNGGTKMVDIYLDGAPVLTGYNDTPDDYASDGTSPIIFFRDDINPPATFHCESGEGAVRYISVSNTTSTAGDVSTVWTDLVASVLPVNLTGFSAQKNNSNVSLQWQTAAESNTINYTVQKSLDSRSFTEIGKLSAKGGQSNSYAFTDASGYSLTGKTYYRLKITDINGNYKYSPVVTIYPSDNDMSLSVFPNPAKDLITVSGINNSDVIRILNVEGKLLYEQAAGSQSKIIDIRKFAPGTYVVQVISGKTSYQSKVIKY